MSNIWPRQCLEWETTWELLALLASDIDAAYRQQANGQRLTQAPPPDVCIMGVYVSGRVEHLQAVQPTEKKIWIQWGWSVCPTLEWSNSKAAGFTHLEEKLPAIFTEREREESLSDKVVRDGRRDRKDVRHLHLDLLTLDLRDVHVPRNQRLK